MRKHLLPFGIIVVIITLTLLFSYRFDLSAQSGCCKERQSVQGVWYPNGLNYKQCFELNQALDHDDMHAENGRVWWAPAHLCP